MLEIKHTICSKCGVGCGLNVISKNNKLVGIHPFKVHMINEGRNCDNCRNNVDTQILVSHESIDYDDLIDSGKEIIKSVKPEEVTILVSGTIDNDELDSVIDFSNENNFNLVSYEYNFEKIGSEMIPDYDEVEKASTIIAVGDIFRGNPLISRRIIHAKDNGCRFINIHTIENLTGYNCDEFIKIDDYSNLHEELKKLDVDGNTILVINEINDESNYMEIINAAKSKGIKVLPVLKHPNSYSVLNKVAPSTIEELNNKFNDSSVLILINENPNFYLDKDAIKSNKILSLNTATDYGAADVNIPVQAWFEKDGSFTNSTGLTQEFKIAIPSDAKSVSEVLKLLME